MDRRAFLRAVGIGAGTVAAAPVLALVPVSASRPSLTIGRLSEPVRQASIDYMKHWTEFGFPSRLDVLYGFPVMPREPISVQVMA